MALWTRYPSCPNLHPVSPSSDRREGVYARPAALPRRPTDWLAHRPGDEALDASDELQLIAAMVVATSDTHEPGVYAGPCDICGDELYAKPGARVVHCRLCNVDYDVEPRRQKLLKKAESKLLGAADIARVLTGVGLKVTPERVRTWIAREQLKPAGIDRARRPLYRLRDAQRLAEQGPFKATRQAA